MYPQKETKTILKTLCILLICLSITPATAYSKSNILQTLSTTWEEGRLEVVVPVHTWHNRAHYSKKQIDDWNEDPWGLGLSKTYTNEKFNRHRLIVMTFQDSHNKPQPTFGYSWQAVWRGEHTIRPTLGFIAGFTMRNEFYYIPVPAAVPIAGLDIGAFSLEATYIPFADVLFTWVTWRF